MNNKPFESVIVGIDFSPYSKIVVKQAQKLAQQFQANLVLVHAVTTPSYVVSPELYDLPDFSETELADLKRSAEKFYRIEAHDLLQIVVEEGSVTNVILKTANKFLSPLIVVGSQGQNAVSRFVLGSEAEKIALKSPYPVWVHRGKKTVSFDRVLVPTDLSDKSQKLIEVFKKWSKTIGVSPDYLYVRPEVMPLLNYPAYREMADDIKKSTQDSIRAFRKTGPNVPLETVAGVDPSTEISNMAHNYDVIAMNPHNRSGIFKKFGRVTSKVIRLADNPVLVFKT